MSDDFHDGDTFDVEQPGGYDQLPTAVWMGGAKNGAASPGDVVAYLALRRFGTMRKGAIPGREILAEDMGITVRAVDDRLNGLIEGGWLLITPRFRTDGQGQTSNHYQLFWEPITHQDDPRLVEHRRRVAEFEAWMASRVASKADSDRPEGKRQRSVRAASWDAEAAAKRQAYWGRRKLRGGNAAGQDGAKETARGGEENFHPGAKETARAGAKETAPLEPHPYGVETHRGEQTSTAAAVAPTGRLSATVIASTGTPGTEVDLFGVVDGVVDDEDDAGEPDPDEAHRRTVRTLVAAYVDVVTARGGHCTGSLLDSIGKNVKRVVRNDKIPEPVLLVAVQKAASKGLRSIDGVLAATDSPQVSWDRSPAAKRAMQNSWIEMGRKLDAARAAKEGVA